MADPGFSPGGGANSQNCYYFSHFCRKLHENERIWTPRGGRASLAPPLGSANDIVWDNRFVNSQGAFRVHHFLKSVQSSTTSVWKLEIRSEENKLSISTEGYFSGCSAIRECVDASLSSHRGIVHSLQSVRGVQKIDITKTPFDLTQSGNFVIAMNEQETHI